MQFGIKKPPLTQTEEVKQAVRESLAEAAHIDAIVEGVKPDLEVIPPTDERIKNSPKLTKLIDDSFPFDPSQLAAIHGMVCEQFACLTGAAGTGKTTTTKKLVDTLLNESAIAHVNMAEYWKRGESDDAGEKYEAPEKIIPAIACVSFTGKATQQIKKNFPRDWHGCIMTIHRLLGFVPDYYDDYDEESDSFSKKMRFIPTYNSENKLPWKILIIDEAGMLGLDLWHQLLDALEDDCRVYMIGDINQLPPVHGRSVFGFAMAKWPSFELTHIHRQAGKDNPIVDNAWRILKGQLPKSGGRFQMVELKGEVGMASRQVRAMVPTLRKRGLFEPNRDTIITAINGNDGSRGYALGQLPLNQEFCTIFNPSRRAEGDEETHVNTRYFIDAGRERRMFAIDDKVMATKNDHEAGITNGMTGIITNIETNPAYAGDWNRWGPIDEVNAYMASNETNEDDDKEFSLEELSDSLSDIEEGQEAAKEKKDRGPASHIVTVRFGEEEAGFELQFNTLSEVSSLMLAYVVTCHKMQGGESPTIVIICHDSHKAMLYREWLYTAVTRASNMCILLYTPTALRTALNKQSVKGTTLAQKVESFNALQRDNGLGAAVKVKIPSRFRLYEPETMPAIQDYEDAEFEDSADLVVADGSTELESTEVEPEVTRVHERVVEKPEPIVTQVHVHHHHTTIVVEAPKTNPWAEKLKKAKERESRGSEATRVGLKPAPKMVEMPTAQYMIQSNNQPLALPEPTTYDWNDSSQQRAQRARAGLILPDPEIIRLRDALAKRREQPKPQVATHPKLTFGIKGRK